MIVFDHVSKTYPNGYQALKDINLTIEQGEFVAIIGLSGAGKSTLIDLRAAFRLDGPRQRTLWKCVPARWHCLLRFGARNCRYRPEGYCCC